MLAAGVDGCPAGWIAAVARGEAGCVEATELRLFATVEDLIAWRESQSERDRAASPRPGAPVTIDIPIGLPAVAGPRVCDREARRLLGRR